MKFWHCEKVSCTRVGITSPTIWRTTAVQECPLDCLHAKPSVSYTFAHLPLFGAPSDCTIIRLKEHANALLSMLSLRALMSCFTACMLCQRDLSCSELHMVCSMSTLKCCQPLGSRRKLTWVVQDLILNRIVQDDHALAPAGSHVGLQRAPEQREVPGKDNEDREVPAAASWTTAAWLPSCSRGAPHCQMSCSTTAAGNPG